MGIREKDSSRHFFAPAPQDTRCDSRTHQRFEPSPFLQLPHSYDRIDFEGARNLDELEDVDASLAPLELRDERLRAVELLGEFDLGKSGATPCVDQKLAKVLVLSVKGCAPHPLSLLSEYGISQNRLWWVYRLLCMRCR